MSILKKIFFISLFVFVLSLLFWGVYNLSFKDTLTTTSTSANKNTPSAGDNPTTQPPTEDKISLVSKEPLTAPVIAPDGANLNYLSQKSSQFMQIDFYGNASKTLSSKNIAHAIDAYWSVDKTKAIIKIATPDKTISFYSYDTPSQTSTPLKKNLDQVFWQTNANRIIYKFYDPATKERTLNVADPDGSNWAKLADLTYKNLSAAQIPATGLVSFWNTGDAYEQTILQAVPLVGGESKTILTNGFGADYLWSPSGDWILASRSNSQGGTKMELGFMNANGGEYKNLGIPTFASKCLWSKDGHTIYYALPGDIPADAILPNDYKSGKFKTTDTFWKVDIKTGEKTRLIETADIKNQYDASQLFLNASESLLFFVNKLDGKLYKITL